MTELLLTLPVETSIKGSGNEGLTRDPRVPRQGRQALYITKDERPSRGSNDQEESYTRAPALRTLQIVYSITAEPQQQEDLAEELSLRSAAEVASLFIRSLPDDVIDLDLGPGV